MAAYETSTATLRKVLAHPSLQMSHVDSTMDNLAEALADQLEIDEAIQSGGKAAVSAGTVPRVDLDDDVLAAELEELMKEDEKQNEGEKKKQEEGEKEKEAEGHPTGTKVTEPGSRESGYERQATKIREQSRPSDGPDWKAIDEAATVRKEEEERRAAAERLRKEANRPAMITDSG
jgi:charged multivesicular body protein 7